MHMKLSEWAKKQGISYKTAWRWVRQGKMPVPFVKTPTGTILVQEPEAAAQTVALYARVSSADQKPDLDRQIARQRTGLGGYPGCLRNRARPERPPAQAPAPAVRSEGKRYCRRTPGPTHALRLRGAAQGRQSGEVKDDLVQDMIEVLTSFCARLYGRRSARNKAKKALEAMEREG